MQYVSWKDDQTVLTVPPKKWTLMTLTVDGKKCDVIKPAIDALAMFAWYINVDDTGGAKSLQVRFSRDPRGLNDYTGQTAMDLTTDDISSHVWFIKAKVGTPIGVMLYHEGTKPLKIGTREFKAAIGV
jgi:hypothetical protein